MSILPYEEAISKWSAKKKEAQKMAEKMTSIKALEGRGLRMAECSTRIEYTYCQECGSLHIAKTNLCRDRLCPVCSWRLSLQRIGEMMASLNVMYQEAGRPIQAALLTLTVRNCRTADLGPTIDQMMAGWGRLRRLAVFKRWVYAWARSIEVTEGTGGTFHPHIHVLVFWQAGYDKEITQRTWSELWKKSCRMEYTPIVDIRSAYCKDEQGGDTWDKLIKATAEATKYAVKPNMAISMSDTALEALAKAISGRRLLAYGGAITGARKALGYSDADEAVDVSDTAIECPKCGSMATVQIAYWWAQASGSYILGPINAGIPEEW